MISVAEARTRILAKFDTLPAEFIGLDEAAGRVLAKPLIARLDQPAFDVSAMDGYAARSIDLRQIPCHLRVVGESAAGRPYLGHAQAGEAIQIFTGARLPDGTDCVILQENTEMEADNLILTREGVAAGRYVRRRGMDFAKGDTGLTPPRRLSPRDIGLAAAMDNPWVWVRRKPQIAILSTGDEITLPGEPRSAHQIVSANSFDLAALVRRQGAIAHHIGVAKDNEAALRAALTAAANADLLVISGGASVGKYDLVPHLLSGPEASLEFWRIAMRPGKPLMFGRYLNLPVLGLPGNPVSSYICAILFLVPVLKTLLGLPASLPMQNVQLGADLPENTAREAYLRARWDGQPNGTPVATPFDRQDSHLLADLAEAHCLVIRPPFAPAAPKGTIVPVLSFQDIEAD